MGDLTTHAGELLRAHLERLACPVCHAGLRLETGRVVCMGCTRRYPIVDGLPVLIGSRAENLGEIEE